MRKLLKVTTCLLAACVIPTATHAQQPPPQDGGVEVDVTSGVLRPYQIAIAPFSGPNGSQISEVISGNLRRSGFFEPINPASFIETGLTVQNQPNFPLWTNIGAQAVLYGSASMTPIVNASWSVSASPPRARTGAASRTRFPTSSISV